jgi:hypothetical protein
MRLREFIGDDQKLKDILENASSGATGSGSIASIANPVGGIIKRIPTTPNLFGYIPTQEPKPKKKRKTPR